MTTPRLDLRSTAQIIKQTSASFSSSFYTFIFLSLLLFSFRTIVENGALIVTAFIDRDPSFKALISRLDLSGKNDRSTESFRSPAAVRSRRRRPFLHLSRVGTLDDDFFSTDDGDDRSLFGSGRRTPVNGSYYVNYSRFPRGEGKFEFLDSENHDGIRFSDVVASEFVFRVEGFSLSGDEDGDINALKDETTVAEKGEDVNRDDDFQFFYKGFELGRRDAAVLFSLVSFLSAIYGWVIVGFVSIYSCILGIVFFTVVNNHLGKSNSFVATIRAGSRLGIRRLPGFILMRWAVRDALTQLLGLWYFGDIEDQYSFFKLFVRLKLMPFSVISPWIRGYEKEISRFLFTWFLSDTMVAFAFVVDCWIAIMDSRKSGRQVLKEGGYMIFSMFNQSIQIKCWEAIFCGSFLRWVLTQTCGKFLASILQSVVEVYFMVAWVIFYFAARCKDANSDGRRFGRRNLEDYVNGLR